jgi:hypothetical protein
MAKIRRSRVTTFHSHTEGGVGRPSRRRRRGERGGRRPPSELAHGTRRANQTFIVINTEAMLQLETVTQ